MANILAQKGISVQADQYKYLLLHKNVSQLLTD